MAKGVWILAEVKAGKIKKTAFELLSGSKKIAEELGEELVAVILGSGVESLAGELGHYGASKVLVADDDALKDYTTDAYTKVIVDLIKEREPSIFLGPASAMGKDLLPRVAARLQTGMASDCIELKLDGDKNLAPKRPVYAGKAHIEVSLSGSPQMAAVRPNVLSVDEPDTSRKAEVEKIKVDIPPESLKVTLKEVVKGASEKVDLTEASIIISGGRAMKDAENFKLLWDMAEVFGPGTTVGASRAAVDSGYAPQDMQVGQTGKVVNPNLYIACGISGAIQHLAGMRTSKIIVAINKDPEAPIFQKADYGVVGDLFKVVPVLTEEFKKLLSA
ncbi:MAG: electron transfer flavoprotein subunit alpha/FixB family protein [Deltaproteobacteria bacterium]|nr:MAG: electron transfer flavoprotein subunit alpha/FixB family protein [Deltaproteobacteria bacterium]